MVFTLKTGYDFFVNVILFSYIAPYNYKNIERHKEHNIIRWPKPNLLPMIHIFDLMIIKWSTDIIETITQMGKLKSHGIKDNIIHAWRICRWWHLWLCGLMQRALPAAFLINALYVNTLPTGCTAGDLSHLACWNGNRLASNLPVEMLWFSYDPDTAFVFH